MSKETNGVVTRGIKSAPKPKRIWDNYIEVAEVQKSDRIKYIIAAATRDGVKYLNIREFYLRKRDNEWRPGRDGITIPLAVPIEKGTKIILPFSDLQRAFKEAYFVAKDMELADAEKAVWYTPQPKETK